MKVGTNMKLKKLFTLFANPQICLSNQCGQDSRLQELCTKDMME